MRTLGPIVKTFTDIWDAYAACKRLGREYSVTSYMEGFAIRRWVNIAESAHGQ